MEKKIYVRKKGKAHLNINVNGNNMQCHLSSRTGCRALVEFESGKLHVEVSGLPYRRVSTTLHTSHRPVSDRCSRTDVPNPSCSERPQKLLNPYSGAAALLRHNLDNRE
ncbi:hypothetical protein [Segatella oulorum]|uniref:hypothetical protein n=1 Tax=Segatella oulorum TaxID=28136 RepID=UPI0023F0D003|nr:hypothetical protein [Segatella oulorum]